MNFGSVEEIKQYILTHSQGAVEQAKEQVYQIINRFVKEYYAEYSPSVYERTYQFYSSLVKTDVMSTGNGWKAEIYFDASGLDYAVKTFYKFQDENDYYNPFNGFHNSSGVFPNNGDAEKTVQSAMHGSHGGKIGGTAIWDESIGILSTEAYEILKRMLIANGIPIH